ncbi:MAG TPA: hypothetical protein VMR70_18770 [Flavisolibacter sp.]|nr:hypothetical protein [Flavisolibacter sp.]
MTKKVIGIQEFKNLPERQQLDLLHQEGVHVGKRMVGDNTVILYQFSGFYVEVLYKSYRKEVEKITISKDVAIIHPYLDQIAVRDLDKDENTD